jgi:hypothetical protein
MRVLLQGSDGLFFQDDSRWVKDPAEARCFKSGTEVIDFAASKNITGALVVYEFGGKMFDFTVPIKALEATGDGLHSVDGSPIADRQ